MTKFNILLYSLLFTLFYVGPFQASSKSWPSDKKFDLERDLLLVQFDCKTDVDDLHTVAGLVTLLADPQYSKIRYHAVAGTYGIQDGLYVPPNPLFELAFGDNWTDAHKNKRIAVEKVAALIIKTLELQGDIWIAEAGQSDFTASVIRHLQTHFPSTPFTEHIHVVQHSDWNEKVTTPRDLQFVKDHTNYHKIPDGNAVGNGTPGFRSPEYTQWKSAVENPKVKEVWQLAVALGNQYNGKEGRYNNEAIAAGGLDFSDLSEVCWILGLQAIRDSTEFFERFGK